MLCTCCCGSEALHDASPRGPRRWLLRPAHAHELRQCQWTAARAIMTVALLCHGHARQRPVTGRRECTRTTTTTPPTPARHVCEHATKRTTRPTRQSICVHLCVEDLTRKRVGVFHGRWARAREQRPERLTRCASPRQCKVERRPRHLSSAGEDPLGEAHAQPLRVRKLFARYAHGRTR